MSLSYLPKTLPTHFYVVGGGGTGGRLVPLLAQFLKTIALSQPGGWLPDPHIIVIDDDVVEEKNLKRQNFIRTDIGKPKAKVLASRYGKAYDIKVSAMVKRIDSTINPISFLKDLKEVTEYPGDITAMIGHRSAMLILCVDSAKARREVLNSFFAMRRYASSLKGEGMKPDEIFVIDAGNEDTFGQIKFFHLVEIGKLSFRNFGDITIPKFTPESSDIPFIPMDVDFYANLEDNGGASCASLDQTLAINATMAVMMMGVIQNYMYRSKLNYTGRGFNLNGGSSTDMLSLRGLEARIPSNGLGRKEMGSISENSVVSAMLSNCLVKYLIDNYVALAKARIDLNREALTQDGLDELKRMYTKARALSQGAAFLKSLPEFPRISLKVPTNGTAVEATSTDAVGDPVWVSTTAPTLPTIPMPTVDEAPVEVTVVVVAPPHPPAEEAMEWDLNYEDVAEDYNDIDGDDDS